MNTLWPYAVGIAFWAFVAVATVAGIVSDYRKRQLELEPLRLAIERGQTLDPAVLEHLLAARSHERGVDPQDLQIGGIITTSSGIGVIVLGPFLSQFASRLVLPCIGLGLVAVCVGVGLIVSARAVARNRARSRGPEA
jgi:hypothetical protein